MFSTIKVVDKDMKSSDNHIHNIFRYGIYWVISWVAKHLNTYDLRKVKILAALVEDSWNTETQLSP